MQRWGGRAAALTTALVAGLLAEVGPATAAPTVVAAPLPRPDVPSSPGGPSADDRLSPAQAAQAAFGPVGSLVVVVAPDEPPTPPGTSADAAARASAGTSVAGDAERPVPTASLVKLYLAEGILTGARRAGALLPTEDLAWIEAMLTSSDDPSASQLWVTYDGPAVLADVVDRYGLTATTPPSPDPGAWGSSRSSAADLVRFLTALPDVAHPDDAALVLDALGRATPTGADGFDQSFGLLSPGVEGVDGAKQGWMCCVDDVRHLHSVGLVGDRVVVLLSSFPPDLDWSAARAALDAAAVAAVSR
ncbi:LppW family protein [Klenkia sp. PcliD-1-E]|uniref:LppW family protein n=1 Tax=Klenkia sp. PcliD-1-E TaxID=2954492 RepID=UPI0020978FE0|nr:LppW family protein [Klenkia sp. PcliD-1-E]MCO7218922.1 LppW family protein [Klenkia sp. PcliD-1-E]